MSRALRVAAFGLVAAAVGFIVAPQILGVAVWTGSGWMPAGPLRFAGHVAYEAGIWLSGVAVWLVVQRLGILAGRRAAVAVILAPAVVEILGGLALGRLTPGISTWPGFAAQLLVAAGALALGLRLTRHPDK